MEAGHGHGRTAKSRWVTLSIGIHFSSAAQRLHQASVQRMQAHGGATTTAATQEAIDVLKRWEQGDSSMYDAVRVAERFANRSDGKVREALNDWWQAASAEQQASPSPSPIARRWGLAEKAVLASNDSWKSFLNARPWTIERPAYDAIFLRVQKALLEEGEDWDEQEAAELIDDAWMSDTKGRGDRLTRTEFNDSLFEVRLPLHPAATRVSARVMWALLARCGLVTLT